MEEEGVEKDSGLAVQLLVNVLGVDIRFHILAERHVLM